VLVGRCAGAGAWAIDARQMAMKIKSVSFLEQSGMATAK
jgi:hypothetical protein